MQRDPAADGHGGTPACPCRRMTRQCRAPAAQGGRAQAELLVRHAIRRSRASTLDIRENQVTALIGPSGCGKSTFLRCFNRMHDLQPDTRYEGEIMLHPDEHEPRRRRRRPDRSAHAHRHGVPEAQSVPEVGLRERRLRPAAARRAQRATLAEKVEKALRGAALWDEVKDRLQRLGARAVRRPAAAAVHRARAGDQAGDPAVRRADVGARSDRHRARSKS